MQKVDILAIGVHPDDIELGCSGTLLSHIAMGKTVGLLDLTRGELGTRGSAEIRDQEATAAAKLMGATFRVNLGMADGFFQYTKENLLKIITVIRACQPEIVLINAPHDRHPDHGRSGKLEADACYYSGLAKIETHNTAGDLQERWRPQATYHYVQDYNLVPDFVVDISEYMEAKIDLIMAYSSQFHNQNSTELETPLTGKGYLDFIRGRAKNYGRPAGFDFAEGYVKTRDIGVKNLFNLV